MGFSSLNHSTLILGSPRGTSLHSKCAGWFSISFRSGLICVLKRGGCGLLLLYSSSSDGAWPSRRVYSRTAASRSKFSLNDTGHEGLQSGGKRYREQRIIIRRHMIQYRTWMVTNRRYTNALHKKCQTIPHETDTTGIITVIISRLYWRHKISLYDWTTLIRNKESVKCITLIVFYTMHVFSKATLIEFSDNFVTILYIFFSNRTQVHRKIQLQINHYMYVQPNENLCNLKATCIYSIINIWNSAYQWNWQWLVRSD